jgi:hypothetical protein
MRKTLATLLLATAALGCDQDTVTYCPATTKYSQVPDTYVEEAVSYVEDSLSAHGVNVQVVPASASFAFPVDEHETDWVALRDSLERVCGDTDIKTVYTTKSHPSQAGLFDQLQRAANPGGETWPSKGINVLYAVPQAKLNQNAAGVSLHKHNALHEAIHALDLPEHSDDTLSVMYKSGKASYGQIPDNLAEDITAAVDSLD